MKKLQNQLIDKVCDERDSLKAGNDRLIQLLTDIRFALGDDGKRMQDEFVEYCKEVKAERDRLREFINGLNEAENDTERLELSAGRGYTTATLIAYNENWEAVSDRVFKGDTPLEAVEAYLNSKAGSGVEE